jgi:hypothetical protein
MKTAKDYLKENDFIANDHGNYVYGCGYHNVCLVHILQEYAELYANAKLDEAAENATVEMQSGRNGCKIVVNKESILSLKDDV